MNIFMKSDIFLLIVKLFQKAFEMLFHDEKTFGDEILNLAVKLIF